MPKLVLTFLYMEQEHIGKDVSCVPYYLGKALNYDIEIISLTSATNRDFPREKDGIHYKFLFRRGDRKNGWYKLFFFWWYLLCNARKIDILMRFHYSVPTIIETIIYKTLNPKGKVYIKCDTSYDIVERFSGKSRITERLKSFLYKIGNAKIDVISCETYEAYEVMSQSDSPYFAFGDRLVYVPNGFDEELRLKIQKSSLKSYKEKENIIITVGRLGTEQKNTTMLLSALAEVDMLDWKCYLIGPIDPNFQPEIEAFYEHHPEKIDSVKFIGPIYDKQELWEYYNSAKVFVLTSRWESYGLVLVEAKRFGCYLISTDVGAAEDLIGANEFGEYVKQDDCRGLHAALQNIIQGESLEQWAASKGHTNEDWDLTWDKVLLPVVEKLRMR